MKIRKTYKLITEKNLTMHMPLDGNMSKCIQFRCCSMYDTTGSYSTSDKAEQRWLESLSSFGTLYVLAEEEDITAIVKPSDAEVPVFENTETDVLEFPNFNTAKKYAIDSFGVDAMEVRDINSLTAIMRDKGVSFKIG